MGFWLVCAMYFQLWVMTSPLMPPGSVMVRQAGRHAAPAAGLQHGHDGERREAHDDQEELQHFVIDRAGESAEEGVGEHDGRGAEHAGGEIPAEHQAQQQAERVHRNAGGEDRHAGKAQGVERARLFVEAKFEVLGDGAGAAAVVEGHHEDADEDHGRDGAHPVEVGGHDAVLGAAAGHADQFLRAEIGRQEGEAGDPDGDGVAGGEEVLAGGDLPAESPSDAEDEPEIDCEDGVINRCEFQKRTSGMLRIQKMET